MNPALKDAIAFDIAFILGETRMPIARLLELRRGAVVMLGEGAGTVTITANRHVIAHGELLAMGDRLALRLDGRLDGAA